MPTPDAQAQNLDWTTIRTDEASCLHGTLIELDGWMIPLDPTEPTADYFLLNADEPCCGGCVPRDPLSCIEVVARESLPVTGQSIRVRGRLQRLVDDAAGWRYRLADARACVDPEYAAAVAPSSTTTMTRRAFLATGAALGLAACTPGRFAGYTEAQSPDPSGVSSAPTARAAAAGNAASAATEAATATTTATSAATWRPSPTALTIDMHSHEGHVIVSRKPDIGANRPLTEVNAPMREGGMNVICLAIVTDTNVTRVSADHKRFEAWRAAQPGELYALSQIEFRRASELIERERLLIVTDAASLATLAQQGPCVIVSAEGADFLEGQLDRLDEAYTQHRLRHLQLTHYRVNELGDIQTEPPVHGGLTDFGADVVRRCNALGIVVDVAHGTYDLVKRAAATSTKPLVLSHTALATHPRPQSRLITPDHARAVAGTGGVIGVWPSSGSFHDLQGMAHGMRRMVDVVGVEHVGLGTDMLGFISPPVLRSYRQLPALGDALRQAGFSQLETEQILGGNYRRVFEASMV